MNQKTSKYPILKAISQPFLILTDNFCTFAKMGAVTAFILFLISFIFAQSFLCMLPNLKSNIHCGSNVLAYILYILIKLFILSSFLRVWTDCIFLNKSINIPYFKQNIWRFVQFFGFFLLFLFINSMPLFSLYFIIIRVPNPVWQIELLYFLFVSLGFLIPFVLLRFYKNIALFIKNMPCLDFKKTYTETNFQLSRIFFAFSIILALCYFFFLTINSNLKLHIFTPLYLYNMLSEYIFECTILCVLTILINFIMVQEEILDKKVNILS